MNLIQSARMSGHDPYPYLKEALAVAEAASE